MSIVLIKGYASIPGLQSFLYIRVGLAIPPIPVVVDCFNREVQ